MQCVRFSSRVLSNWYHLYEETTKIIIFSVFITRDWELLRNTGTIRAIIVISIFLPCPISMPLMVPGSKVCLIWLKHSVGKEDLE